MIDDALARKALLSFMDGRCDVSSQHKLPSEQEVLATVTAGYIGRPRAKRILDELVKQGIIIRYDGDVLSDHAIEVL